MQKKKRPFSSDRTQFRVILPNLNYGIGTNEPNPSIYLTKKEIQVFSIQYNKEKCQYYPKTIIA